jgi:hypothetical protein
MFHPIGAFVFVTLQTSREVCVVDPAGKCELFRFGVGRAWDFTDFGEGLRNTTGLSSACRANITRLTMPGLAKRSNSGRFSRNSFAAMVRWRMSSDQGPMGHENSLPLDNLDEHRAHRRRCSGCA